MARDTVTVPRDVLERIEFASNGYCPACDGWLVDKWRGATPGKHTPTCELAKALSALSDGPATPPSSDPEGGARGVQGRIADGQQCNEQSGQSLSPAFGIIDPDYARIFTIARCLAWAEGYAIAMHGSFTRDLDLIAVPWAPHACEPEHLAKRIESVAGLKISASPKNDKPFGRLVWTLTLPDFGDPRFVDLSIIPRSLIEQDGQAELSEVEQRMIDLAWEAHKAARPIDASTLAEEIRTQMYVRKTCVVSGVEALATGLIEAFTITQLTKTPSADHDAGNLRSLAEPNHQPHAVSQGWHDGVTIPPVERGREKEYVVAVFRQHSGKVYTFAASYLNAYPLVYQDECPNGDGCDGNGCDDGCPTTGWFRLTGDDGEAETYVSLNIRKGDRLMGWRELPQWEEMLSANVPAPPSPAKTGGAE